MRKIIIVATAALLVGSTAALAKNAVRHQQSNGDYGYSYVPADGYGSAYRYGSGERHDPTDTNGF